MPLNPEHKARWIADLRSDKFTQGNGFLYNIRRDGYCCIGVDFVGRGANHNDTFVLWELDGREYFNNSTAECVVTAYPELTQTEISTLMTMNDAGVPFSVIADWIEKNL